MIVHYQIENNLKSDEFLNVLIDSGLGERRPIGDKDRIALMIKNANLIITARSGDKLVGVARSMSDFAFATYMSDLAVAREYQKFGIGKELIRQTMLSSGKAKLILLAAPAAVDYYPRIGMTRHNHCYILDGVNDLK